jgi:hypothetical protein
VKFDDSYVEKCIMQIALRLNKTEFCNELKLNECGFSVNSINSCNCHLEIALVRNNPSACGMPSEENTIPCLANFIQRNETKKLCGDETDNLYLLRENCVLSKIGIILTDLSTQSIDKCIAIFSSKTYYGQPYQQGMQENDCKATIAIGQKSLKMCDEAEQQRMSCYDVLASVDSSVTLEDCDKLGADYQGCYINIAIRTSDTSICGELAENAKYNCLERIALDTNNISLCAQLQSPGDKQYCANVIYNRVKENLTMEICDAGFVVQSSMSYSISWVEECYFNVAKKTLDTSLCDKSGRYKEECKTVVSHAVS